MKAHILFAAGSTLLLAACGATSAAPVPSASDAVAVYRQYIDTWNRHDVPATMAMYADDATFTGPFNCTTGCSGKDGFRSVIERQANINHETGKILDAAASGGTVTAHLEVQNEATRSGGFSRQLMIETMALRDGRISSLRRQLDMTDPETVRFASTQAVAKPAPSASPSAPSALPATP